MRVVKDLVPDLSKAYEQLASIKPWLERSKTEKENANNLEEMIKMTKAYTKREKIIKKGEKIVITAGLPLKKLGTTNLIRVIKID